MSSRLLVLVWLLAGTAASPAAEESRALRVSNDGLVSSSAASGATTWTGAISIEHPRFHLVSKGTAAMFGGPSLRRISDKDVPMKTATFSTETQWISLVVLGSITITVHDAGGDSTVTAHRVVYTPSDDRLMLDGVLWHANTSGKATPSSR